MLLFVVEKGKSIPLPTSKNKDYHNCLTTHPLPQKIACTISTRQQNFCYFEVKKCSIVYLVAISPRSPDLSPCDFFLWNYVKGLVFVPPLPTNIEEMKQRITVALETTIKDMLQRVWHELEYRLDGCRVIGGAHIEHLWKSVIEPTNICTFLCKFNL